MHPHSESNNRGTGCGKSARPGLWESGEPTNRSTRTFPVACGWDRRGFPISERFTSCKFHYIFDVELSLATGIHNSEINRNRLLVFPQPANDVLSITINSEKRINSIVLNLYDLSGKNITEYQIGDIYPGSTDKSLDVSNVRNGIYLLRSADGDFVSKLVVSH